MSPITPRRSARIGQQQQVKVDNPKGQLLVENKECLEEGSSNNSTCAFHEPSEKSKKICSSVPYKCQSALVPAEPSSPSKRRLHSGTIPSPKKSKSNNEANVLDVETITTLLSHQSPNDPEDIVETVDAPLIDQSSNDPEDTDEIVNAKLQAMIERTTVYNHETLINKTRCDLESKIAADRAKTENNQDLAEVLVVDQKWETAMLHRTRLVVRIARDGSDQLITAPYSTAYYVHLAREILHRIRPADEMVPGCDASDCDSEVELETDFNLDSLMKVRGEPCPSPVDLDAFEAAAWFIRWSLRVDREKTFRCIAAHPYYCQKNGEGIKCSIKQELINFFDRRFTFQMGRFFGIDVPVDGALLRLGPDFALYQEVRVDCGGFDEATIVKANVETWAALIKPVVCPKTMESNIGYQCPSGAVTQEKQHNEILQPTLTPKRRTKLLAKKRTRNTDSEVESYKMITKQAENSGETELPVMRDDSDGLDSLSHIIRRAGDIMLA